MELCIENSAFKYLNGSAPSYLDMFLHSLNLYNNKADDNGHITGDSESRPGNQDLQNKMAKY